VKHSGTKHLLRRTYIKEGNWLFIKKNAYENNAAVCNEKMILFKKSALSELIIFLHLCHQQIFFLRETSTSCPPDKITLLFTKGYLV
jgi:hypothetical protein